MDIILLLLLFAITLVVLCFVAKYLDEVIRLCEKNRIIREECEYEVPRWGILITPTKLIEPIKKNVKIIQRDKDQIEEKYKKVWKIFCFYESLVAVHVVILVWMICLVIKNITVIDDMMAVRIAAAILESVFIYNIYLTPLFDALKLYKLAAIGPIMWNALQHFCEKATNVILVIMELLASILILLIFLKGFRYFGIDKSFWMILMFFIIYQYILLRLLAKILKKIIFRVEFLSNYRDENCEYKMYMHLKSTTFIGVVIVNAMAIGINQGDEIIWKVMGIVFLLDTYIEQRFPKKLDI